MTCTWAEAGPGCGARRGQRHHHQPNFARNLTRSFFETPQKRCNSNDANSMFELVEGELRAKLLRWRQGQAAVPVGGGRHCTRYVAIHPIRTGAMPTDRVQCLRIGCNAYGSGAPHNARIPQRRVCRPARIARRQQHTKPQDPQAPPVWRAPESPEGTGGLQGAAPSHTTRPGPTGVPGVGGPGGPGCGARGRRRGMASEKSHAIRLDEVSIKSENVAIPTL